MDKLNLERIAAEVSTRHHIRVDPDDPMMTVVTINRIAFESAVEDALGQIRRATQEFDQALQQFQLRVGGVIGREVRQCITNSTGKTNPERNEKVAGTIKLHWSGVVALGVLVFALGVCIGSLLR